MINETERRRNFVGAKRRDCLLELLNQFGFSRELETMLTIAADHRHLGARIGTSSVFYACGSA